MIFAGNYKNIFKSDSYVRNTVGRFFLGHGVVDGVNASSPVDQIIALWEEVSASGDAR